MAADPASVARLCAVLRQIVRIRIMAEIWSYRTSLCATIRNLAGGLITSEETDDVLQACFAAACQAWPSYRGEDTVFRWLAGIAAHKLRDMQRQAVRMRRNYRRYHDRFSPYRHPMHSDLALDIQATLGRLPRHYRQALILRYVHGLPVGDVARALGLSYKSCESVLSRARSAYRRLQ